MELASTQFDPELAFSIGILAITHEKEHRCPVLLQLTSMVANINIPCISSAYAFLFHLFAGKWKSGQSGDFVYILEPRLIMKLSVTTVKLPL